MIQINTILLAFATLCLLSVVTYLIGYLFSRVLGGSFQNTYFGHYYYLLSGLMLICSIYAIIVTKGVTILLPIPFLLAFLTRALFKDKLFKNDVLLPRSLGNTAIVFSLSLVLYSLYYLQGFAVQGNELSYLHGDQNFYVRVAQNLNDIGVENMRVEYLYPERFSVEPYHFGDLWFLAFLFKVFSIPPIFSSVLIAAPFLNALAVSGILAFVSNVLNSSQFKRSLWLVILVGFVGGFASLFPTFIFPYSVDVYAHSYVNYTKLLWWVTLLPLMFLLIFKKRDGLLVFPLFIIGLGYINVLPSMVLGTMIWLIYISLKRRVFWKNALLFGSLSMVLLVFLYFLYVYYPSLQPQVSKASAKADFNIQNTLRGLRTSLNIFIGGGLQFLVFAPVFLLWILMSKVSINFSNSPMPNVFGFSFLLGFSSLIVWSIMSSTTFESIQLFYNVFVVVMGMISLITYLYFWNVNEVKWLAPLPFFLIVISIVYNRHYDINTTKVDRRELKKIVDFVSKEEAPKFVHYRKSEDYSNDVFGSSTVVAMPLGVLSYFIDQYQNFSLNAPFAALDSNHMHYVFQKNNIAWAPMSYFVQQPEQKGLSEEELMIKFIKLHHISFVTSPISVNLPSVLQQYTSDSVLASGLGWKIYSIRFQPNSTPRKI